MIITSPEHYGGPAKFSIFLAGTIDGGRGKKWQDDLAKRIDAEDRLIYNPYRHDFRDCEQSVDDEYFYGQVDWEYKYLTSSDLRVFYFSGDSVSPITLLELGLTAHKSYSNIVFCENDYFRKGNVDYIINRYNIQRASSFDEVVERCNSYY